MASRSTLFVNLVIGIPDLFFSQPYRRRNRSENGLKESALGGRRTGGRKAKKDVRFASHRCKYADT